MLTKRGGFACCPVCNAKMTRILPSTEARDFPAYCRSCKRQFLIDIERGQSYLSRSPDLPSEE